MEWSRSSSFSALRHNLPGNKLNPVLFDQKFAMIVKHRKQHRIFRCSICIKSAFFCERFHL